RPTRETRSIPTTSLARRANRPTRTWREHPDRDRFCRFRDERPSLARRNSAARNRSAPAAIGPSPDDKNAVNLPVEWFPAPVAIWRRLRKIRRRFVPSVALLETGAASGARVLGVARRYAQLAAAWLGRHRRAIGSTNQ